MTTKTIAIFLLTLSLVACDDWSIYTGLPLSSAVKSRILQFRDSEKAKTVNTVLSRDEVTIHLWSTDLQPLASSDGDKQLIKLLDREQELETDYTEEIGAPYMTESRKEKANEINEKIARCNNLIDEILKSNGITGVHSARLL